MTTFKQELYDLTHKIENDEAELKDYQRYEYLLKKGGLSDEYIHSYLEGINSWEELIQKRKNKDANQDFTIATIVGGIVGVGIGVLIAGTFNGGGK